MRGFLSCFFSSSHCFCFLFFYPLWITCIINVYILYIAQHTLFICKKKRKEMEAHPRKHHRNFTDGLHPKNFFVFYVFLYLFIFFSCADVLCLHNI